MGRVCEDKGVQCDDDMRISSLSEVPSEAITRFMSKFTLGEPDECWLWSGTMHHTGYGVFQITIGGVRKQYRAHQVAHIIAGGTLPTGGQVLMHSCDVKICVNPKHISVGTVLQNNRDAVARLGASRGMNNGHHVLTDAEVMEIRRLRRIGVPTPTIAETFGISSANVYDVTLRSWKHIPNTYVMEPAPCPKCGHLFMIRQPQRDRHIRACKGYQTKDRASLLRRQEERNKASNLFRA